MRYHYEVPKEYVTHSETTYYCDHPLYNECTLFWKNNKGLAVIQQDFDPKTKHTFWRALDPWLFDELVKQSGFDALFDILAKEEHDNLFPTITIRKLMWKLRMKPLPKERWETTFDRFEV